MNVDQTIAELKRLQRRGYGKLPCMIFAHDQNPEDPSEGDGTLNNIDLYDRYDGTSIIALKP